MVLWSLIVLIRLSKKMNKTFVAGIDGGGTKTECFLADDKGNILDQGISGPSNPRNQGLEMSAKNIAMALTKALGKKKGKIITVFIGLAAAEEEYSDRMDVIKKELLKDKRISKNGIFFGSDQEAAFRSGTEELDGVVVIVGTGCVIRGWNHKKEAKAGGWGYFADEGSAFWTGQRAYQAIAKELDGRGDKTLITRRARVSLEFKDMNGLNEKIYNNPVVTLPLLSVAVDEASKKGDEIALAILKEGSEELVKGVVTVVKKLGFKEEFPLVITGGMFKSKSFKNIFRNRIEKIMPLARFTIPFERPVFGSLKLAMEKRNEENSKRSR